MDHLAHDVDTHVDISLPDLPTLSPTFPWENLVMLAGVLAGACVLLAMLWR